MTILSASKLPRSGRITVGQQQQARVAFAQHLTQKFAQERTALLEPIQAFIIQTYAQNLPASDVEVCRRYRLLDSITRTFIQVFDASLDSDHRCTVYHAEIEVPQNYSIGFHCGGVDQSRFGRTTPGTAKGLLIDASRFRDHFKRLAEIDRAIHAETEKAKRVFEGFHDGNTQVRPLWTDIYRTYPELQQYSEGSR